MAATVGLEEERKQYHRWTLQQELMYDGLGFTEVGIAQPARMLFISFMVQTRKRSERPTSMSLSSPGKAYLSKYSWFTSFRRRVLSELKTH